MSVFLTGTSPNNADGTTKGATQRVLFLENEYGQLTWNDPTTFALGNGGPFISRFATRDSTRASTVRMREGAAERMP